MVQMYARRYIIVVTLCLHINGARDNEKKKKKKNT